MKSALLRKTLFMLALVGLSILGLGAANLPSAPGAPQAMVSLAGTLPQDLNQAQVTGPANANQPLQLSISLSLRSDAALQNLLHTMYTPASPTYHHFLTPAQFSARFAPTQAMVNRVTSWLKAQGLRVGSVASNHVLIDAGARVAQAEKAFQVHINNYTLNGHAFYAPDRNPTLPASLSAAIQGIDGLDNMASWGPLTQPGIAATGPAGGFTPSELRTAYDFNGLIDNGDQGDGQTVAIFELDGYNAADIAKYRSHYDLTGGTIENILVNGATGKPGAGALEVDLDIEVVFAVAPHVTALIYEGPNSTQGLNDTYDRIVTDNRAQVMSTSWGDCEATTGTTELQTLDDIFAAGASQGISFFAASGDSGAYGCKTTTLDVDSPADDPYVTGVGGTTLTVGTGGTYTSESAWNCPACTEDSPKGDGGGGGLSTFFATPGFQVGPGTTNSFSNGKRQVPDVSADADPDSDYSIFCTASAADCPASGWTSVGGTSAAAPLWAGAAADMNQYLTRLGKSRLGFANPTWYLLACNAQTNAPFHDVTTGNNLFYPATAGYDQATGIGSPNVWNIARDLGAGISATCGEQLILNGGFEDGQTPWVINSNSGFQIIDSSNPHTGTKSARLCGYNNCTNQIWQDVTLPRSIAHPTLTFWWFMSTQEKAGSPCFDSFSVYLVTSAGMTIARPFSKCNSDANNTWQQVTIDLTGTLQKRAGQSIRILFSGVTNNTFPTVIYVDDVTLTVS